MSFLLNRLKQDLNGSRLALIRKNLRQQIQGLEDLEQRFLEMAQNGPDAFSGPETSGAQKKTRAAP